MLKDECGMCGCEIKASAGKPTLCDDCLASLPERRAQLEKLRNLMPPEAAPPATQLSATEDGAKP